MKEKQEMNNAASVRTIGEVVMAEGISTILELTVGDMRPIVSQNCTSDGRTAIIGLGGSPEFPDVTYYITPRPLEDEAVVGLEANVTIIECDRISVYLVFSPKPGDESYSPWAACLMELSRP